MAGTPSPLRAARAAAAPLAALVLSFPAALFAADNDQWWDGFAAPPNGKGMDYRVSAFAEYGGDLIVGGGFTQAGNNGNCNHVGRFHNGSWAMMWNGVNDWVSSLVVSGPDLYVGGSFTYAGFPTSGTNANHVVRWDGTAWVPLGDGVNGPVSAMAVHQGDLVVAGDFTEAGGVPANRVARWNGTSWSAIGAGLGSTGSAERVTALAVFDGDLYAGGDFEEAGGVAVTGFARWNGTDWSDGGATLSGGPCFQSRLVQVLSTEYDGNLLVGGCLGLVNGVAVNGLASFDGTTWTPLGVGLNEPAAVWDVATYHGDLVVSGSVVGIGASTMTARWNGSVWSGLGSGLSPFDLFGADVVVHSFGADLYFGGNISVAGVQPSSFIARWTDAAVDAPELAAAAAGLRLDPAGANPFRVGTAFTFSLPHAGEARVTVHDAAGRLVEVLADGFHEAGTHRAAWEGRSAGGTAVASGVYFVRLDAADGSLTRKVVTAR